MPKSAKRERQLPVRNRMNNIEQENAYTVDSTNPGVVLKLRS